MRKNIIILIITIMFGHDLIAQPFIYFNSAAIDSEGNSSIHIICYNLSSKTTTLGNQYFDEDILLNWDPSQTILAISTIHYGNIFLDLKNGTEFYIDSISDDGINECLYSFKNNSVYITSEDYSRRNSPIMLTHYNLSSNQTVSFKSISAFGSGNVLMMPIRNSFFSADSNKIYFYCVDTMTRSDQVWVYSIGSDSIVNKMDLLLIGHAGSDGHDLVYGRNGKGIVCSYPNYNNPIKDFYYRVYDFDKDSGSAFIYHNGSSEAYFTNNGRLLLIMNTFTDDSLRYFHTGKCYIYNTQNAQLLKTLIFPSHGYIYTFDSYPNNIYYVKDIESPERQIFVLKMDSIFNELDLSSLAPSTVNVNSPPFILTVKGKGFDTVSTVYFNGQPRVTTFISDSVLTAEILASDILTAGTFPVWLKDEWAVSDTLQFTVQASSPNLLVNLKSSIGTLLTTGSLQYYEGSWKDAVNNGDGTFTVITNQNNVSLRMTYEYAQQTVSNIPAHNNTYTFQTVSANVQLKNSQGLLIDTGTVQYYAGAWRNFGTTANGVAAKELLPINYSFRMSYEFASIDKQQNLSVDPTVVFQTVNAQVQLKNSLGNFQDIGTVQYYAGAWRSFGTTTNGVATKELLPINYSFRMTYEYASIDKQQNLSVDPTVVFQTVNAQVQLKNSLGNLIDQGAVQYYAGAWRSFGTTTNGVAAKELLPINYSFRMTHAFLSKDKQQNLSANPAVDFQTVLCTVKVTNSTNQPLNNSAVKYYAGAWRDLGATNTNGITTKELLPQNISFRASYGSTSKDKQQDITTNNLVEIQIAP